MTQLTQVLTQLIQVNLEPFSTLYEALENKKSAIECYIKCLKDDSTNVEAFTKLMDSFLINNSEKEQVVANMTTFSCEDLWLKKFYNSYFKENVLDENKSALNLDEPKKLQISNKVYTSSNIPVNQIQNISQNPN